MRITNAMRDSILEKESNKKFYDIISSQEKDFNDQCNIECGNHIAKITPEINSKLLEENWLRTCNSFDISNLDDDEYDYRSSSYYPKKYSDYNDFKFTASAKLKKLYKKWQETELEETNFYNDLRLVLNAYSSHKPLLLAMPELSCHFENEVKAMSMAVVPIEQIESVRKLLVRP